MKNVIGNQGTIVSVETAVIETVAVNNGGANIDGAKGEYVPKKSPHTICKWPVNDGEVMALATAVKAGSHYVYIMGEDGAIPVFVGIKTYVVDTMTYINKIKKLSPDVMKLRGDHSVVRKLFWTGDEHRRGLKIFLIQRLNIISSLNEDVFKICHDYDKKTHQIRYIDSKCNGVPAISKDEKPAELVSAEKKEREAQKVPAATSRYEQGKIDAKHISWLSLYKNSDGLYVVRVTDINSLEAKGYNHSTRGKYRELKDNEYRLITDTVRNTKLFNKHAAVFNSK